MPFAAEQQRQKVPVTIITGFLGAGKTSLLNYMLKNRDSKRIAVVENEFGEVNIDRELVIDNLLEEEDLVSLENGCVCCSLRKDIVKAFAEIEKRSCQRGGKLDAILLETTGLADPAPVAFTFFANPWVASRFKLDSILCVVDARYLLQHLEDQKPDGAINEAVQQLAFSDLIVLNKIDLVSEAQKADVVVAIRSINSSASIVECQLNDPARCPPLDQLLGVNSFSVNRALEVDVNFLDSDSDGEDAQPELSAKEAATAAALTAYKQRRKLQLREAAEKLEAEKDRRPRMGDKQGRSLGSGCAAEAEAAAAESKAAGEGNVNGGGHVHGHNHKGGEEAQHEHGPAEDCSCCEHHDLQEGERQPKRQRKKMHDLSDISSISITARGPLDDYRFNMFMRDLLSEKAKDIFRCKGVLAVHGQGDKKFIFQGVHETICYGPADKPWQEGESRVNKVVFIGKALDRKALLDGFRTCVWVPLCDGWSEHLDPKTKQPFYVEKATGKKSWTRPDLACAHVEASHASTTQPKHIQPKGK